MRRLASACFLATLYPAEFRRRFGAAIAGLAIGWPAAALASRFLGQAMGIPGSSSTLVYLIVIPVLGVFALAACFLPARRAMNLDAASVMTQD